MKVSEFCTHKFVFGDSSDTLLAAARRMSLQNSDYLLVIEKHGDSISAKGVLTDRDIINQTILEDIDPGSMTLADIIIREPVIAREEDEVVDVIARMTEMALRCIPVIDSDGKLTGVITIDFVFNLLFKELSKARLSGHGSNGSNQIRNMI